MAAMGGVDGGESIRESNQYRRRQAFANPFRVPNEVESSSYSVLMSMRNNHNASLTIDNDNTIDSHRNTNNQSIPTF